MLYTALVRRSAAPRWFKVANGKSLREAHEWASARLCVGIECKCNDELVDVGSDHADDTVISKINSSLSFKFKNFNSNN